MGGGWASPAGGAFHRGAAAGRPDESQLPLIGQIRHISRKAEKALQKANITSDTEIQKLTREHLNKLLPRVKNQKRRKIDERIRQSLPNPKDSSGQHLRADSSKNPASEESVKELKEQMNQVIKLLQSLYSQSEAGTGNNKEVLGECLTTLKEMRELLLASRHQSESGTRNNTQAGESTSLRSLPRPKILSSDKPPHTTASYKGDKKQRKTKVVKVHCVVSGKTLGSHQTLLQQVKAQGGLELQETHNPDTGDIIILFCPIVSRMGTDIEAAMKLVPGVGEKVIIRVVLHHTFNEDYTVPHVSADSRVKYDVSALFHNTKGGLLQCDINNQAVQQIHSVLLMYRSTG